MAKTKILRDDMIPEEEWLEQERPKKIGEPNPSDKKPSVQDSAELTAQPSQDDQQGKQPDNQDINVLDNQEQGNSNEDIKEDLMDMDEQKDDEQDGGVLGTLDKDSLNNQKGTVSGLFPIDGNGDNLSHEGKKELTTEDKQKKGEKNNEENPDNEDQNHLELINDKKPTEKLEFLPDEETPLKVGTKIKYDEETTYTITEFVNRGGFALTYKVRISGNIYEYILKEFCTKNARRYTNGVIEKVNDYNYTEGLKKFEREPKRFNWVRENLKNLSKKRVAVVHTGVFEVNSNKYFVQDLVVGETLLDYMTKPKDNGTPMTVALALDIAEELCKALIDIHEENIVHFDLSPGNVMFRIMDDGKVELKVIDFGLSTTVQGAVESKSALNGGTDGFKDEFLPYIPKNQELKNIDIYSFGALMNYMLFFNYEYARLGNKCFLKNKDSLEKLLPIQPYAAKATPKDEQKRHALIELIKWATCAPDRDNYQPGFRPDAHELLQKIQNIKADLDFEDNTAEQMKHTIDAAGGIRNIVFHSDMVWEAEMPQEATEWIVLDKDTGSEKETSIIATIKPNLTDKPRQAEIVITNSLLKITYTVRQAAGEKKNPDIRFPDGTVTRSQFKNSGDVKDIIFTANDEWTAIVSSEGYGWLNINKQQGQAGQHSIQVTAQSNDKTTPRQAKVVLTCGEKIISWSIEQQPAESPFIKFVDGTITERKVQHAGGTVGFSFNTNTEWEAYTIVPEDSSWVRLSLYEGKPGSHTLNLSILPNGTYANRDTVIRVSNKNQYIDFVIKQEMKPKPEPKPVPPVETVKPVEIPKPTPKPETGKVPAPQPEKEKPVIPPVQKPTERPTEKPVSQKDKKEEKVPWPGLILLFLIGIGVWFWYNGDFATSEKVETPTDNTVPVENTMVKPASEITEERDNPVDSLNNIILQVLQGKIKVDQVIGNLASDIEIYERYGDNDVEVGSTMRQLLLRHNNNIVLGETHRVIELYTDPDNGKINEIIIGKK